MSTLHVLGEYAEKIVAALTVYNLQNRYDFVRYTYAIKAFFFIYKI